MMFSYSAIVVFTGEKDIIGNGNLADILELTYLVDVIFRGGPAPPGCN